jgi:hypothetical protein
VDSVHIHCCGYGCYWFRPYGESLAKAASNQALLPLSFGASLGLGIPSLRSCSVGPPPSAIHGRGRLTRHPCRAAHCAEPALGLPMGQENQQRARRPDSRPGSLVVRVVLLCFEHSFRTCKSIPCRSRLAAGGVPTIASFQAINMSTDPPPSPASRLLQGIGSHGQNCRSQLAGDGR